MKIQILIFICLALVGCGTLQDVHEIAEIARKSQPIVDTVVDVSDDIRAADDIHDWAGIAEKIAYGVAGVAALVAGNEVRRRRKRAKNNG